MTSREPPNKPLDPVQVELWCPRGPELPWRVMSVRGREALAEPYRFEIEVICDDAGVEVEAVLGADAELLLTRAGHPRPIYGVIVEVEVESAVVDAPAHVGLTARLVLAPAYQLLAQEVDTRFHSGQSVVEILAERLGASLGRYGREIDVESRLIGDYPRRDYCVQFRESTFDFCNRLMEEEGIAHVFVPDSDGQRERMVLVDHNQAYPAVDLLVAGPLSVSAHAPEELERESLLRLDWCSRRTPNRVLTRGHNYKQPKNPDEGRAEALDSHHPDVREQALEGERRQIIDDPVDDPDGQRFTGAELEQRSRQAQLLLERHQLEAGVGRGRSNAVGFVAGAVFEHAEPRSPAQGALLLLQVSHQAKSDGGPEGSYSYVNHFECAPRALGFRPQPRTPKPRVYGVQTGVVVGPGSDDPNAEVHTDALGRVRVRFHGDRHGDGLDDDRQTCWIRVAQAWAGPGYGAMVLPRVGMEVVVAFVDGNPDCPLITGCVYDGENTPPRPLPAQLSRSTFRSSSTPGGEGHHELMIEDAKGHEQLFVRAQRRMDLRVGGGLYQTIAGHLEQHIGPSGSGDSEIGDLNTLVRSDLNLRVQGSSYSATRRETHQITGDYFQRIQDHKYFANATEATAETLTVTVGERSSHAAKQLVLSASEDMSLKAGERVVIESNNCVVLKVGDSFMTINHAGIDLVAPRIRLNSGGRAVSAEDATMLDDMTFLWPIYADMADDGEPGRQGGSGGGRRQRRENQANEIPAHNPPPLVPAKPSRPKPGEKGEVGGRTLVSVAWAEAWVRCSEPTKLVCTFAADGPGQEAELLLLDADDGSELYASGQWLGPGRSCEVSLEIHDLLPRRDGDVPEPARRVLASIAGVRTPAPLELRFLHEFPVYPHEGRYARFSVWMKEAVAYVGSTIEYVRGWMGYFIDLSDYVPLMTGGRIGGFHHQGHINWRYAKRRHGSTVKRGDKDLLYWDGDEWVAVPGQWTDPMGTRLHGLAIWVEDGEVKTEVGLRDWPDPVPDWPAEKLAQLPNRLAKLEGAIERKWSDQFDLKRTRCISADPSCCRHPLRCDVQFSEVEPGAKRAIVIAANFARAHSGAWPLDSSNSTAAHEFGHHLGNPDEYPGALSVDPSVHGDGAVAGIDNEGLMGSGGTVRARYLDTALMIFALASQPFKLEEPLP